MEIPTALGPNPESPLPVQPRQGPLYHPAIDPQPAPVRLAAPGEERLDPQPPQPSPVRLRVVAPVAVEPLRAAARPAAPAPHRRDRLDQSPQLRHLVDVGGGRG